MVKSEIRIAASSFRNSLTGKKAMLDTMSGQMAQRGWRTVYFHDGGDGDAIIEDLSLEGYTKFHDAFIYQPMKIIFLNKTATDKPHRYAHEVAHIVLGHDLDSRAQLQNDEDANAFADQLVRRRFSKNQIIALAASVALGVSLFLHIPGIVHPKAGQAAAPVSHQTEVGSVAGDPSDIVVITKSGDKYHRSDCVYVQNKTNTQELTREKAEALKKQPCAACKP